MTRLATLPVGYDSVGRASIGAGEFSGRLLRQLEHALPRQREARQCGVQRLFRAPQASRSGALLQFERSRIHRPDLRAAAAIPFSQAPLHADSADRRGGAEAAFLRCGGQAAAGRCAVGQHRHQRVRNPHSPRHPLSAASGVCARCSGALSLPRAGCRGDGGQAYDLAILRTPAPANSRLPTMCTRSSGWRIPGSARRSSA